MPASTETSPEYVKLSLAAAMQLGYSPARFHRGARMTCINILLTYAEGCAANCAYCGLARERRVPEDQRSFIRVPWPVKPTADVIARIARNRVVQRTCISMITHARSLEDSIALTRRLRESTHRPVSVLLSPTLVERAGLEALRQAGVDRVGVAFDLATEPLFDRHRGRGAHGPHRWDRYWEIFATSVEVFGVRKVGSHFICGLGETEREMAEAFQRVYDLGGVNHLFSFFPEGGSALADHPQPPMEVYRRIQIACELIDTAASRADRMQFNAQGQITAFGVPPGTLDAVIDSGNPFRTRGCEGTNGDVACNRPYANSLPDDDLLRNYPFVPAAEDLRRIRAQIR